ncbi:hypothetical protein CFAM422_010303 [Trichoderma lentiforme]|uniref:Protein kinase domain-containing protein n=1 Tax=Trichoderma lentiforme TaxID=1567552 RepID=A0A9P4X7S0_9HYPO|nr:hypothetical protein CFAM422_010303 [Trichoderma lentiforme]
MPETVDKSPHWDVALWETHETEGDCTLVIRTDNGRAFYCQISPSRFHQSPTIKDQYFRCLNLLHSSDEEDDFYMEDACDWLSKPFEPLITRLVPRTLKRLGDELPTSAEYLFPSHFVCSLSATDEKLKTFEIDSKNLDWGSPVMFVKQDFLDDLDRWTQSHHPNEVTICYDNPPDVLIKPPKRVLVDGKDDSQVKCFFKRFEISFGLKHAKMELDTHKRIAQAQLPPPSKTFICHLHGVVRDGNKLAGMLFTWINTKGVLSKARADQSTVQLKARWATQIKGTLEMLHHRNIIWGDVKAENILIDMNNNAWIIDFGGSYTVGWVEKDKAGTLKGDAQGLARILDILS